MPGLRALLAMLLLAGAAARAAVLTGVSVVPAEVTVVSDGPVAAGTVFALAGPDRLVIDVPAVVAGPLTVAGAGSVRSVRLAAFQPGIARLVLDLDRPVLLARAEAGDRTLVLRLRRAEPFEFEAAVKAGRRPLGVVRAEAVAAPGARAPQPLEIEIAPAPITPAPITPAGAALPGVETPVQPRAAAPVRAEPPPPAPVVAAAGVKPRSGAKPLVVIDPGHGGKDVGAISVRGGYEKDVTLAIARATARALERSGRVRVRLTRDDDRFIPLGGRVRIARDARADLFISIHADAALNQEARGASVYTLSATASDAVAAALAARENKADIIGGINLGVEAPDVGDILIELSRRGTTEASVRFAEVLQAELSPRIRFRSTFHHFAGFAVLKAPDVPSVLLETGYVTNGEDADFLFSAAGQRAVGDGVARAIERYLLGS